MNRQFEPKLIVISHIHFICGAYVFSIVFDHSIDIFRLISGIGQWNEPIQKRVVLQISIYPSIKNLVEHACIY